VSTSGGEGFRARFELLHEPADIPRWAARTRLDLASHGVTTDDVNTTGRDLAEVKRLREAIWAAAFAVATSTEPEASDLLTINDIAAGRGVVPQINVEGASTVWRQPVTARQLIVEIARDAIATLSRPMRDRIRMCAGENCYLIYLDTSRPGSRRWCSMQRCGNRNKATAFRERQT
jgi:predicted RNA-binding Zn ribbon-like protein